MTHEDAINLLGNPWRFAVDHFCVLSGVDCTHMHDDPFVVVDKLLRWNAQLALDPSVSKGAEALIQRGRDEFEEIGTTGMFIRKEAV